MCNGKENNNQEKYIGEAATGISLSLKGNSLPTPSALPVNNMYRGYFPLWRKITDWGWYKDSNTKAVFLHLLLTANHKDSDFLGYKIKEGQCVHGLIELSKILGLSAQSIRTSIKHLKSTNEVTTKATNRFTIYTLTNYYKYLPKSLPNNKLPNKQLTNKQQTTNKPLTTSNNDKNIKNDKNSRDDFPHLKDFSFKELWAAWLEVRKIKKVPNTDRALRIALGKLQAHPLKTAVLMLEKAIEGGWKGIYEPKDEDTKNKGGVEEWLRKKKLQKD